MTSTHIAPLPAQYRQNDYDLSNVTPDQVRTILRGVRTGKLEDQDRLFRLMIDSWPRLRKDLNEIAGSVARLPMEICPAIREGEEEPTPQALRILDVVKRAMNSFAPKAQNWELDLEGGVKAMIDAYVKGISVLEIVWQNANGIISPRCYCPIPAKYLAYPQQLNQIDRLMLAPTGLISGGGLVDFPEDQFLIGIWQQGGMHPIHCASLRTLTKHWLGALYGHGWLMQYAQLFGIPWRHIKTDGSDGAMTAANDLLETIGSSGAAVTGPGVELNVLEGVTGSAEGMPQSVLMDIADRACDILLLGQTLTTDVGSSGSLALGDVHNGIRSEYVQTVATWVAGLITNQLIQSIVRLNFGKVESEDMPYCEIKLPNVKDQKSEAERVKLLKEIGVPMTDKFVHETLDVPEPQDGESVFGMDEPELVTLPDIADDEIDLTPTEEMADAAQQAIEAKRTKAPNERGMGVVCMARARDIASRTQLTVEAVRGMVDFFSQCEAGKKDEWKPSGKRWQEYHALGGDHGVVWAKQKLAELKA